MEEKYNLQECDYDSARAQELYGDKTAEELELEWEELKKKIQSEHND